MIPYTLTDDNTENGYPFSACSIIYLIFLSSYSGTARCCPANWSAGKDWLAEAAPPCSSLDGPGGYFGSVGLWGSDL